VASRTKVSFYLATGTKRASVAIRSSFACKIRARTAGRRAACHAVVAPGGIGSLGMRRAFFRERKPGAHELAESASRRRALRGRRLCPAPSHRLPDRGPGSVRDVLSRRHGRFADCGLQGRGARRRVVHAAGGLGLRQPVSVRNDDHLRSVAASRTSCERAYASSATSWLQPSRSWNSSSANSRIAPGTRSPSSVRLHSSPPRAPPMSRISVTV